MQEPVSISDVYGLLCDIDLGFVCMSNKIRYHINIIVKTRTTPLRPEIEEGLNLVMISLRRWSRQEEYRRICMREINSMNGANNTVGRAECGSAKYLVRTETCVLDLVLQ